MSFLGPPKLPCGHLQLTSNTEQNAAPPYLERHLSTIVVLYPEKSIVRPAERMAPQ